MEHSTIPTQGVLCGILAAGGSGERAAGTLPKQFVEAGGRPLFLHALETLLHPEMAAAVIVVPARYLAECRETVPAGDTGRVFVAEGGRTRQESVRRGLEALEGLSPDWVLVHDAARPFLTSGLVARILDAAREGSGVLPVLPVPDSVVLHDGAAVGEYLDRGRVGLVQTPQLFPYRLLLAAHREAERVSTVYTDDASLFMAAGHPLIVVAGEVDNGKVTYPGDLLRAADSLGRCR